jgi:hypothetical protein
VIGAAGCLAGRQMFRWDVGQKMTAAARGWVAVGLGVWLIVGVSAEVGGHVRVRRPTIASIPATHPATEPTSQPTTTASIATTEPATRPSIMAQLAPWTAITPEDIAKVTYDDLPSDQSTVTPVASGLDDLDDDGKKRMDDFTAKLDDWQPGKNVNLEQRVRNVLAAAAITDILQDQHEGQIAYIVFEHLRFDVEEEKLKKILTYISQHPEGGKVPTQIPELGIDGEVFEDGIRERVEMYARKLLARLVGKVPG